MVEKCVIINASGQSGQNLQTVIHFLVCETFRIMNV